MRRSGDAKAYLVHLIVGIGAALSEWTPDRPAKALTILAEYQINSPHAEVLIEHAVAVANGAAGPDERLTTAQAAAAAHMTPASFRRAMTRLTSQGHDLRIPADHWRDRRTPLYDAGKLAHWLRIRPGQGRRAEPAAHDHPAP